MNTRQQIPSHAGLTLGDVYYILFRHKWKILLLSLLGISAAAAYYYYNKPPYQSEAKLFVRYVLDSSSANPAANNSRMTALDGQADSIMNSEMEIMTSLDLAQQVATTVGPEKILAKFGGGSSPVKAGAIVRQHLQVIPSRNSSVIHIIFQHPDPAVVQPVLNEMVSAYLDKHRQIHTASDISDDFLSEETSQLRSQIAQTEEELRAAKTNLGIISLEDAERSYSDQIAKIRGALYETQTQLGERQAALKILANTNVPDTAQQTADVDWTAGVPQAYIEAYEKLDTHLKFLKDREHDFLARLGYTLENKMVQDIQQQIATVALQKAAFEKKYPQLAGMDTSSGETNAPANDVPALMAQAGALRVRCQVLSGELRQIQNEAANVDAAGAKIRDLEQRKQIQQGNYQYFATRLEQARIDETLGPGRVSNINLIENPTPPFRDYSQLIKIVALLICGGIGLGLARAFVVELYLDHTVRRPVEVETKLKMPLLLAVPKIRINGRATVTTTAGQLLQYTNGQNSEFELLPTGGTRLDPFCDALRDRLIMYFETNSLNHKPKFIALTSPDKRAGVSTLAAGLAASLSETGDGSVLLVNMNVEHGIAQQYFSGQPGCKLDDVLEPERRLDARVNDNLFVVNESSNGDRLARALPQRFAALMPRLKESDYDYVIFDMPPVNQTSVTSRLAGFMDMVLLVIESEKTDREVVNRANSLLSESKATVCAVLNKTRNYIPTRLHREFLSDN